MTNVISKTKFSVQSREMVKGIRLRDLVLSLGHTLLCSSVNKLAEHPGQKFQFVPSIFRKFIYKCYIAGYNILA